jgi:hypothetical protein
VFAFCNGGFCHVLDQFNALQYHTSEGGAKGSLNALFFWHAVQIVTCWTRCGGRCDCKTRWRPLSSVFSNCDALLSENPLSTVPH